MSIRNTEIAFVTQTTLSVDETAELIGLLKEKFPNIIGPSADDICYATQNRQDAVKQLSLECDCVIVIGSETSSNSNRLKELAEKCGAQAWLVDSEENLEKSFFKNVHKIGITAGASAPEYIVQDVIKYLKKLGYKSLRNLSDNKETISFKLPKELA